MSYYSSSTTEANNSEGTVHRSDYAEGTTTQLGLACELRMYR